MKNMHMMIPMLALAGGLAVGCSDATVAGPGPGEARLSIYLTDAPGDVAAVWVEVLEIYLHGSDGRTELLEEPTGLIELTELLGTSVPLVEDAEVQAGSYSQPRFVIGRAAGMSGMWVKHPVIHAVPMQAAGRVTGTVAVATEDGDPVFEIPACPAGTPCGVADFVPLAVSQTRTDDEGAPIVRSGSTSADGTFRILSLVPGSYDLGYANAIAYEGATLQWSAEVTPSEVTLGTGATVSGVQFTLTGAGGFVRG